MQSKDPEQRNAENSEEPTQRSITGFLWAIVVLAVLSFTFLYALDNTITANIRPGIVRTFDNNMGMLPWISVSYPLGEIGSCPFWGALYRRVNNKWMYIINAAIFTIGSAAIGSAHSMDSLIAGRVIAGFGGSGIYVGTMNIMSAMTLKEERAKYLSYVGVGWAFGTILGPIVGGALEDSAATWRWAFYLNVCIAAVAAPACFFLIPSLPPPTERKALQEVLRLDWTGAILFAGGIASIIMILSFGGVLWTWDSGRMIGLYVAAVVLWIVFAAQQLWSILVTNDRIFPVQHLGSLEMCNLFAHTAIAISNIVVTIYTLPLFFQFVHGDSAIRSGLSVLPFAAVAVAVTGTAGGLFPKYPVYMPWFTVAGGFMLIGGALLTTASSHTSRKTICGYSVVQSFGCGLVVQLPYTVAQVKSPPKAVSSVTAFLSCAQMAGLAFSLGIATSVFINESAAEIAAILPDMPRSVVQDSIGGIGTSLVEGLAPDVREQILDIIARSIGKVFYLNVAGGAWALLTSFALKRERLVLD